MAFRDREIDVRDREINVRALVLQNQCADKRHPIYKGSATNHT
jgi:hypothetical protein